MTLNLSKIHSDTPGKINVIHFNNAGAALMPISVIDTQIRHINLEANIGGYEAMAQMADKIENTYNSVAKLIGASADEIAIVENATVGWAMAFYAIDFKEGDRILTVEAEYISNYLAYLHLAAQKGVMIDIIPSDDDGTLNLNQLEDMIDDKVKLISATHVPTNSGLVNTIEPLGEIAARHNILYLVDACQSVGQMPIDVKKIKCDILTATSRKYLRGPRGVGFLYVKKSVIDKLHPPIIDLRGAEWMSESEYKLRDDAKRFENWENNYAALLGFGAAVDYALDLGLDNIQSRVLDLANYLRNKLNTIKGITPHILSKHQCGITTFYVENMDASTIVSALRKEGINTSVSSPDSTLLDATKNKLPDLVRASVHYYNDEREIDKFTTVLKGIIN